VESPQLAARRATLYCLHVSAIFGGLVGLAAWIVFRYSPAAAVAGAAWFAGGLLALLSRRSPVACLTHRTASRGALLHAYGTTFLALGGLLLARGA
jgi:hypothetical protein